MENQPAALATSRSPAAAPSRGPGNASAVSAGAIPPSSSGRLFLRGDPKRVVLAFIWVVLTGLNASFGGRTSAPAGSEARPDPVGTPFAEVHAHLTDSEFTDPFSDVGVIAEASRLDRSLSPFWWVNSGGCLTLRNGRAMTLQGDLPAGSRLRAKYNAYSPGETDQGAHPQNIFRLVTRTCWLNSRQEAYFRINRYILSPDVHRCESNGLLLFSRYRDADNLYYAGIRVDGCAIIKKKMKGKYYELAYRPFFTAEGAWDRKIRPNLLPTETWFGVRCEVQTLRNNNVRIRLWLDRGRSGKWELAAETVDTGRNTGGSPLREESFAGIRTDFMDAEFDDYAIFDIGSP